MKLRHVWYCSIQNLLSSCLLFKILKIKVFKTIILSAVLYGYGIWCLPLMEVHKLRVLLNRLLRIFAYKRKEMSGGSRRLHNYEFNNVSFSQNIIRLTKTWRMRCVRHIAHVEEKQNAYKVLVGKRPLRRLALDWMIMLKWILKKYGWIVWIESILLRQGPIAVFCDHGNEHLCSIKCWELLTPQDGLCLLI